MRSPLTGLAGTQIRGCCYCNRCLGGKPDAVFQIEGNTLLALPAARIFTALCIKRTKNIDDFCGNVNHNMSMQERTIDNALLAIWKRGGDQAELARPLMIARGVGFPHHVQTAPLSRGRCKRFVLEALRKAPATTPGIADLLQADMPGMPRRSSLNRAYCCLLRLEAKGLVRREGQVWAVKNKNRTSRIEKAVGNLRSIKRRTTMDTDAQKIYARLTVHEFILEVFLAQMWAQSPKNDAELARLEILKLMKQSYLSSDADPEHVDAAMAMLQDAGVIAERFLEKVASRSDQIREAISQGQGPP